MFVVVFKVTLKIVMRKEVDKSYQFFRMLLFNPIYRWKLEKLKCNETWISKFNKYCFDNTGNVKKIITTLLSD